MQHTLFHTAALTLGSVGPDTGAAVLIEMQAYGALHFNGITFNAVIEDIAD